MGGLGTKLALIEIEKRAAFNGTAGEHITAFERLIGIDVCCV